MSTEDNSGGWSEDPLHDKENPFYNIQPREEYCPGGRYVTVKIYNQEKTSPEQIQRVHHKLQTRPDLTLPKKHLKKSDHFWKSILWTAEKIKIILYQNDGKKKAWRRLGTAHDPHTASSVKHGGAVWCMSCMASSGTGLLLFSDDETEDRSSWMNSEVYRDILSAQIQSNAQSRLDGAL